MGNNTFSQLIVNGGGVVLGGTNAFDAETRLEAGADTNRPGELLIGNSLALGAQPLRVLGGKIHHSVNATMTVSNDVYLDGTLTSSGLGYTLSTDDYLVFAGTTTLSSNRVVDALQRYHFGFSGPIVDGGNGFSLTKRGLGNLRLSGANAFGGGVRVEAGTLLVNHAERPGVRGVDDHEQRDCAAGLGQRHDRHHHQRLPSGWQPDHGRPRRRNRQAHGAEEHRARRTCPATARFQSMVTATVLGPSNLRAP